ncbi:hypothetical protein KHC23_08660 [Ancylobacter dichloromethanicus]|uniref:Uncharacterized protein n=1 Tax=Ancylobacter dichloromethanicus TaxID=518825 RepID=A0A9W6N1Y6_9HYPH|nr:hypothetical protein [Ancylobacter dichloromethanicus]MBS7553720.1 hypothetical protein [Ancylobacter dichloromethanicus]GLK74683.1 hypothetical protein GCM10017643_48020 [Ancylobacter dichloromethanicus]
MIDHLLRFSDEASAMAALPGYVLDGIDAPLWDTSCVIPDVKAYRITEIREYLPGWYLIIARPERDAALEGEACVLIGDRETGAVLYTITTPEDLATLAIEPTFAGSAYPFGAPIIST